MTLLIMVTAINVGPNTMLLAERLHRHITNALIAIMEPTSKKSLWLFFHTMKKYEVVSGNHYITIVLCVKEINCILFS